MDAASLLLVHAFATFAMTGLIWFVQLVHYPLFSHADPTRYAGFQRAHMQRTTWVVAPLMLTEGVTCVGLLAIRWTEGPGVLLGANVLLLLVTWVSTALVQVPRHNRLLGSYDPGAHQGLVRSNWIRTLAWTARAALVGVLLCEGL